MIIIGNNSLKYNKIMNMLSKQLLLQQSIQLNDQIRKAAFSFDIHNNKVRIFPIPTGVTEGHNYKMLLFLLQLMHY